MSNDHPQLKNILLYFIVFIVFFIAGWIVWICKPRPLVSVVIPTYNRADLLPRAVASILNQTFKDFELIIVDDGSTDETAELLEKYVKQDKRVRVLKNKKNCGISCARNKGQKAARGDFIAILDSDDQGVPNMLEKLVLAMREHPDLVAVSGNFMSDKEDVDFLDVAFHNHTYNFSMRPADMRLGMMFSCCMRNSGAFIRRSFVKRHRIFYNEAFGAAEDYDYWKQILLKGGNLAVLGDVLTVIRFHYTNPASYYDEMFENSMRIKKELYKPYFELLPDEQKWLYEPLEMCALAGKILNNWTDDGFLKKDDVKDFIQENCPPENASYIEISHPYWRDFLIYHQDEGYLLKTKSKGHLKWRKDAVTVEWENYAPETFVKRADAVKGNIYILKE